QILRASAAGGQIAIKEVAGAARKAPSRRAKKTLEEAQESSLPIQSSHRIGRKRTWQRGHQRLRRRSAAGYRHASSRSLASRLGWSCGRVFGARRVDLPESDGGRAACRRSRFDPRPLFFPPLFFPVFSSPIWANNARRRWRFPSSRRL